MPGVSGDSGTDGVTGSGSSNLTTICSISNHLTTHTQQTHVHRRGFTHDQRVSPNSGSHRPENVRQQRDVFRLFVFVWCRTIFSGLGGALYTVLQNMNVTTFLTYLFRKPYPKSGNSSKTVHSCDAELMVTFCTQKTYVRASTFFTDRGLIVFESGRVHICLRCADSDTDKMFIRMND